MDLGRRKDNDISQARIATTPILELAVYWSYADWCLLSNRSDSSRIVRRVRLISIPM